MYRRNYSDGQYRSNSGLVPGYYDSRSHNRESSSRSSDYITRPAKPKSDPISIWVQPDHATYKIRLDRSDSGYAGSGAGSDYIDLSIDPKDDHISPYAHDQGFVSKHRPFHESPEAELPSEGRHGISSSLPGFTTGQHANEHIARREKRSDGYDEDAHYRKHPELVRSSSRKTRHERRARDRSAPHEEQSDYRMYTDGWGSKHNFMRSHGIKPSEPGSYEEAGELLDRYRELDSLHSRDHPRHEDRQASGGFTSRMTREKRLPGYDPVFEEESNYRIAKDGRSDHHKFKRSHGLKPGDPDDYQEANELLHQYRDLDAQYARDTRPEPHQRRKSSHKRYLSHNHPPPPTPNQPYTYDNESELSYQSSTSHNHSARGFSVTDSDFFSTPSPLQENIPHLHLNQNPRNYLATNHAVFSSPPPTPSPYSPRTAPPSFNNVHAGFAYTRAIRQHHSPSSPRYSHTSHAGFMPTTPSYRSGGGGGGGGGGHSYVGSDAASDSIPFNSDDESDASLGSSGVFNANESGESGFVSGSEYFLESEGSRSDVLSGGESEVGAGYASGYLSGEGEDGGSGDEYDEDDYYED
ncbi:hypothetical protein T440DRAFT_509101 [Plenodomus tracheiphilus IPT5]|uniref:Uncharacterized protein n=1 Tax=Plenodomus tracheiphilus IPT5 TaxID=1408161 RepID=A0A6A7B3V2_9PLEO|nr:hypothetical protein T440DRAFT_509101 [Plenodomus tracheiphilus IPT5]